MNRSKGTKIVGPPPKKNRLDPLLFLLEDKEVPDGLGVGVRNMCLLFESFIKIQNQEPCQNRLIKQKG